MDVFGKQVDVFCRGANMHLRSRFSESGLGTVLHLQTSMRCSVVARTEACVFVAFAIGTFHEYLEAWLCLCESTVAQSPTVTDSRWRFVLSTRGFALSSVFELRDVL